MNNVGITIDRLRDFLEVSGWNLHAAPNEYLEVWRLDNDVSFYEILVPTNTASDKERLLDLAIDKICNQLQVSSAELTEIIAENLDNIVSIRVVHKDVESGSIPLDEGITLNKNAKELLVAAANATLERKPFYQGRSPAAVSKMLEQARLGQTAHGSYVVRVICPRGDRQDDESSFNQSTTNTLEAALSELSELVEEFSENTASKLFERAINAGVSANLCDALTNIAGREQKRSVEITIPSYQPDMDMIKARSRRTFTFLPEHQQVISKASSYFRQTYTLANQSVIGVIERLDRQVERDDGAIRITTTLSNGVQRSVSLQLNPDEYQLAIKAHDAKMQVEVRGDIVVTPRTANVINQKYFKVVGNLELF